MVAPCENVGLEEPDISKVWRIAEHGAFDPVVSEKLIKQSGTFLLIEAIPTTPWSTFGGDPEKLWLMSFHYRLLTTIWLGQIWWQDLRPPW